MEELSKRLSDLRKKAGLSQIELAKMLGISNRAVSKWENGISQPSLENCVRLCGIFNISVSDLLTKESGVPKTVHDRSGMESLRELYKIGRGPSSSHTMGPEKACRIFRSRYPDADRYVVRLYGSLAKSGRGHGTDNVIVKTMSPRPCTVEWDYLRTDLPHPNTMELFAYRDGQLSGHDEVYSIGGGSIRFKGEKRTETKLLYPLTSFHDIASFCKKNRLRLWEYVEAVEGRGFAGYMSEIWHAMTDAIERGLNDSGILPGGLGVPKKAAYLYELEHIDESAEVRENRIVSAYAFAVSEQNACGETIVTAPTCGASGVMPSVLYYEMQKHRFTEEQVLRSLMTGGIIGNLIKTNASISGAECGCQAEIGTACAMAAAALGELFGFSMGKIECAAEVAIEHHLGLTCDPIGGLVQIPCIERNAVAAMRAINAVTISSFLSKTQKISFDEVVVAMNETGSDIKEDYRETALGGLAKIEL